MDPNQPGDSLDTHSQIAAMDSRITLERHHHGFSHFKLPWFLSGLGPLDCLDLSWTAPGFPRTLPPGTVDFIRVFWTLRTPRGFPVDHLWTTWTCLDPVMDPWNSRRSRLPGMRLSESRDQNGFQFADSGMPMLNCFRLHILTRLSGAHGKFEASVGLVLSRILDPRRAAALQP